MVQPTFLPKLTKFVARFGTLPTSYRDAMTYEEQILWICSYIENTLLPALNQNSEALEELQGLFIQLKDYVDNYFDNLDVQEEINNKLDAMVEAGTLQEIITAYLQVQGLLCFNNVADMKSADNLIDGSFVRTYGYYNSNDGGAALYKIREVTNQDTEDDMFIIALDNVELVAELIIENGQLDMKQIGARENNTFDCTPLLKNAILKSLETKDYSIIYFPSGEYYFLSSIDFNTENINFDGITIKGAGRNYTGNIPGTVLYYYGAADTYFINFKRLSNSNFKDFKIVGTTNNNCFEMNDACTYTDFNNIEFAGFKNHVWLKVYTGYVRFIECTFDNSLDNCNGIILNQHYTDGRPTTSAINTEYVYFIRCNMDAANHSAKHMLIHEASFLYVDSCDLCNTSDTAIYMDASDWGGILDDIFITNCSFARNKNQIYVKTGTGQCRGLMITDNHYLRKNQDDTTETLLKLRGNSNSRIWYGKISGMSDAYANTPYAIDIEYGSYFDIDIDGQVYAPRIVSSVVSTYDKSVIGKKPRIEYITPANVTVTGNSIEYDLSTSLPNDECCQISINGILNTNGIYLSSLLLYGGAYKQQVIAGGGTNVTSVAFNNKKVTVNCSSFVPSSSLDNVRFLKIK